MSESGFSESCINKVKAKIENMKINYLILDRKNNYEVDEKVNNRNLNTYDEIFERAKVYITYKTRIDNIYGFMLKNIDKEDFKEILKNMEEIIYERGKIRSYNWICIKEV